MIRRGEFLEAVNEEGMTYLMLLSLCVGEVTPFVGMQRET
jgi:hypothetical protein